MRLYKAKEILGKPESKILETQDSWLVAYLRLYGLSVPVIRRNPMSGAVVFGVQESADAHKKIFEYTQGEVRVIMYEFRKQVKKVMSEVKNV